MSCFSCFSSKTRAADAKDIFARPVRSITKGEKVSVSQISTSFVRGRDFETTSIKTFEKEVDIKVSEVDSEYDSEDEDPDIVDMDIEKEEYHRSMQLIYEPRFVKRSVVRIPQRFRAKTKQGPQPRIITHSTGEEQQRRLTTKQSIALIVNPSAKSQAQLFEDQRKQKWELDRYC